MKFLFGVGIELTLIAYGQTTALYVLLCPLNTAVAEHQQLVWHYKPVDWDIHFTCFGRGGLSTDDPSTCTVAVVDVVPIGGSLASLLGLANAKHIKSESKHWSLMIRRKPQKGNIIEPLSTVSGQ